MKTFEGWWLETHPLDRDTAFTGSHKSAMKEAWCAAIEASRESQSAVPSEDAIATVKFAIMDGLSNSMCLSDPEKIRDSIYKSIFDDAIKWATKEVAERGIDG